MDDVNGANDYPICIGNNVTGIDFGTPEEEKNYIRTSHKKGDKWL